VFQAARERAGRWIPVLLASLTAHLVALFSLGVLPHTPATWESNAVDVTFSLAVPQPDPAPAEPVADSGSEPEHVSRTPPAAASRRQRPKAVSDRATRATPIAPSRERSEVLFAIDPAKAARSFLIAQELMPEVPAGTEEGASSGAGSKSDSEDEPRNYFEGYGKKRHLSVRDPPKLRRHRDGTHHYQGHAFKAVVEPDGSVRFDDGYGQGATVRFDITELIMRRHGEDPYRVEKNWFLEGTSEFRQELFERWREKQTLLALRKLRIRLLHISEDERLPEREKAARIIAIFRDTADDEAGASARTTIAEFVAERMPEIDLPSAAP
jgi:hypothetical protein